MQKFTNMTNFLEYNRLFGMLFTKGDQYDIIYTEKEGAFVLTDTLSYKDVTPPPKPQADAWQWNDDQLCYTTKSLFADGTQSLLFLFFFFK